jgi:monofunctional biosynthetic peptidoglycan transglycosylase
VNTGTKYPPPRFCLRGIILTLACLFASKIEASQLPTELLIADFGNPKNISGWVMVNDGVMGGLSESRFELVDTTAAMFSGKVRLENNGGFASTRTRGWQLRLEGYSGILLRVKGDGKTYQFRVRTSNRFDGISYRHRFKTQKGQWQTVIVPFDQCVPVFRGRILSNVGQLVPGKIQQMGFMIADNQPGDFQLEVQWIKAYRSVSDSP